LNTINLNHIPLVRLIIAFILGIILAINFSISTNYLFIVLGCFFVIFIIILFLKKWTNTFKYRWLIGVIIYLNFILSGFCLTQFKKGETDNYSNQISTHNFQNCIGEIISNPKINDKSIKVDLNLKGFKSDNKWVGTDEKIILFIVKNEASLKLKLGDYVSFEPNIENIPPPKNPNEFDYRKYLSYHLIHQQAFLKSNSWILLKTSNNNSILNLASKIRQNMIYILVENGLKDDELAIASALILGYKNDIDGSLKSSYANAGAMHVLAVSGLHVGVIFLLFNYLLKFLSKIKYGEYIKALLLLFVLWFYALITGLSPSVFRSATMFSFIVLAKATNRHKIWAITSVSIAAQIATFPLGLFYFHQFPNYFLLSNLIVIPLAIVILYLGLSVFLFSFIPIISKFLAFFLIHSIQVLNNSIEIIDKLPYSVFQNIRFSGSETILTYLLITTIILLIVYRRYFYFLLSSGFTISLLMLILVWKNEVLNQRKFIVYDVSH